MPFYIVDQSTMAGSLIKGPGHASFKAMFRDAADLITKKSCKRLAFWVVSKDSIESGKVVYTPPFAIAYTPPSFVRRVMIQEPYYTIKLAMEAARIYGKGSPTRPAILEFRPQPLWDRAMGWNPQLKEVEGIEL